MSIFGFSAGLSEAMPQQWLASLAALPGQSETSIKALLAKIERNLKTEFDAGYSIYPSMDEVFAALEKTLPAQIKTVILGQDPYHGGQAHGLCFSVRNGHKIPPSLRNIFSELAADTDVPEPVEGDLSEWASRGVLLLNSVLTVRAGDAGSHETLGWGQLTDLIMQAVAEESRPCVFILWGKFAASKKKIIDATRHLVIESPHPSPLSSYRGFFGSKPFSRCNQFLRERGREEIDWSL